MRVLVIDDHPLIQEAVSNVARGLAPDVDVVAADDCERGLVIAESEPEFDIILLDLNLPTMSGIPALKAWRARFPSIPVIVLSGTTDPQTMLAAINAGAAGFIPKSSTNHVFLSAMRLVLAGGKYLPTQILSNVERRAKNAQRSTPETLSGGRTVDLTGRQVEVLRLIAKGASNKVICRELGLADRTVKAHVTGILRALKVTSRTQAAIEAAKLGFVESSG
jgi:DNA-binding NarL/FixJ family response regulator